MHLDDGFEAEQRARVEQCRKVGQDRGCDEHHRPRFSPEGVEPMAGEGDERTGERTERRGP